MFEFGKNATVDDLSSIPEQFKPFYKEGEDGKFSIDNDNPVVATSVSTMAALTKSLNDARGGEKSAKASALKEAYAAFSEYGTNPDEILAAFTTKLEELQGQLKDGKNAKINVDKIKGELAKAHAIELEAKDKRTKALTDQLYELMVTSQATSALAPDAIDVDLAMPHVKNFLKVNETDGKFGVQVVDEQGDIKYSGTGNPMSIPELIAEMKDTKKFKPLFKSEAPGGGGPAPRPAGQPGNAQPRSGEDTRSATDKISAGLAAKG